MLDETCSGLHVCSQVDSLTLNCQLWLISVSADAIQLEMCQLISATTNKHCRRLLVQFSATKMIPLKLSEQNQA